MFNQTVIVRRLLSNSVRKSNGVLSNASCSQHSSVSSHVEITRPAVSRVHSSIKSISSAQDTLLKHGSEKHLLDLGYF